MNPYELWAQQQYGTQTNNSTYPLLGSNWGAPSAAAPVFTPPSAPQGWGATAMQGFNGPGFNSGANTMMGLPQINDMSKPGFMDSMLGPNGWGGMALSAAGGLASTFLGMKQYGLAKQTLAENKRQFELNYGAQKQTTNNQILGRGNDLYTARGGTGQTADEYYNQRKIA